MTHDNLIFQYLNKMLVFQYLKETNFGKIVHSYENMVTPTSIEQLSSKIIENYQELCHKLSLSINKICYRTINTRYSGLKTGFFSSPHMVSVTERIRIGGAPISQDLFAHHFWQVHDKVVKGQVDKPAYFKFLTVMALNVFWKEQVDVAIIEVGIGGAYDSTNIIGSPVACGITTLDFDHTKILGESIGMFQ
jgi:hypothetical protein